MQSVCPFQIIAGGSCRRSLTHRSPNPPLPHTPLPHPPLAQSGAIPQYREPLLYRQGATVSDKII